MNWRHEWASSAIREMKKLDIESKNQVRKTIENLTKDPDSVKKRKMKGKEDEWRIRCGDYRIRMKIYRAKGLFMITHVGLRKDIYRK